MRLRFSRQQSQLPPQPQTQTQPQLPPPPPPPTTSSHDSPYLVSLRYQCLDLARTVMYPRARKIKVMRRYRKDGQTEIRAGPGSSGTTYNARLVGFWEGDDAATAPERVLVRDLAWHRSEREAVERLMCIVAEEGRQDTNFF